MDIIIENYTDKSFKVSGESTKLYKEKFKELNGMFRTTYKGGPGWVFSNSKRKAIEDLISEIKLGKVTPCNSNKPTRDYKRSTDKVDVPDIPLIPGYTENKYFAPSISDNKGYQTLTYTVLRPSLNMEIMVRRGTSSKIEDLYHISHLDERNGVVEEVYAFIDGGDDNTPLTKFVVINGRWQVLGLTEHHTVDFISQ